MPQPSVSQRRPSTCLLDSLHHYLNLGQLGSAVAVLPLVARRGLRPSTRTLALLLVHCLHPPTSLRFVRRLILFLHLTGLKRFYPSHTFLSNHILHPRFLVGNPDRASKLFDEMPQRNIFSYNIMLAGYPRLSLLYHARQLFDCMPHRDLVSWNTIILTLARCGAAVEAVSFYTRLRCSSIGFNAHTFSALLAACVRLVEKGLTLQAHGQILLAGFSSNLVISSSLVDAYAKVGLLGDARRVFDEMPVRDVLAWTAMVSSYVSCSDLNSARRLFDEMPERNLVSWTILIGGYTRNGFAIEGLNLFRIMVGNAVRPDQFTFSSCICASSAISSLKHGRQIHGHLLRTLLNPNAIVMSSLIDMYSKCGDLEGAHRVFDHTSISRRDVVMWNTMMSAVGNHGLGREAINLFEVMTRMGTKPDSNTFIVLLTACSHSGLIFEGLQFFKSMAEQHGIVPEENHLVCLVDLLGRAGRFREAMDWLSKEPCKSSSRAWNALLGACRIHGNLQLGELVAERLLELGPQSSGPHILLSNIYAEDGSWRSVEKVRQAMEEKGMRKEHAASWVEGDSIVPLLGSLENCTLEREQT